MFSVGGIAGIASTSPEVTVVLSASWFAWRISVSTIWIPLAVRGLSLPDREEFLDPRLPLLGGIVRHALEEGAESVIGANPN